MKLFFVVYEDGKVCISILHEPGEDRYNELVSQIVFDLEIVASLNYNRFCLLSSGNSRRTLETNFGSRINHHIGYIYAL